MPDLSLTYSPASILSTASDASSAASDAISAASDALSKIAAHDVHQDVNTTASPQFVTAKLTGLTDGYVPYKIAATDLLGDSPIYTDGTDVTVYGDLNVRGNDYMWGLGVISTYVRFTEGAAIPHYLYVEDVGGSFGLGAGGRITDIYMTSTRNIGFGTATQFGSGTGVIGITNASSAPSTNPTDAFVMYSADQVAGNACAHFRTELGKTIKLYEVATYTLSNITTDRTLDADLTTLDEVADVLGTLINDLKSTGVLA